MCNIAHMLKRKIKHKFGAKPTHINGIRFDSKIESKYYQKLLMLQKSGELLFFLRQVPIHLPGKTKLVIDFQEFWADGTVRFVDIKGVETEVFKIKKRQVEALYPFDLTIIKEV